MTPRARPGRRIPNATSPETYLFAAGVGIIGGLVGTAFQVGSRALQHVLVGPGNLLDAARSLPWHKALLVPFIGASIAALLDYGLTRRRRSQGMTDVMEAVSLRRAQQLSVRATVSRALSSLALIATGGSVGREGPIAYVSASLGARFARLSKVPGARLGLFAGCGIAAGMSASYFAPLGAVLFAMEVVLGNFAVDILAPVVISSVVSTVVVRGLAADFLLGDYISGGPLYHLPPFVTQHAGEFAVYVVLGIVAAGGAWLFMNSMKAARVWIARIPIHARLKLPLGGLAVGAIGIWFPQVWGNGYHAVNLVLTGTPLLRLVILLFVMKIVATSITLGAGGSGGIFTPTMFLGAALGLLVGSGAHALLPGVVADPRHYAVVGMAAVLAATTQAPIMAIVLLFEMTMESGLLVPLMVASITGSVAARSFGLESMYRASLRERGVRIPEGIEETALATTHVADLMREEFPALRESAPFDEIVGAVERSRSNFIYVTNGDGALLGVIRLHDIKGHLAHAALGPAVIAADLMSASARCGPDQALDEILGIFDDPETHEMPVVDPATGKLLGTLDRRDLISALAVEVLHSAGLRAKFVDHTGATHYVELPPGHVMASIAVPEDMAGKTLRETDFRAKTGLTVLSIVRGQTRVQPDPQLTLQADDRLIVMGPSESVNRLERGEP